MTEADEAEEGYGDAQREVDLSRLRAACAVLAEHFDTVHVFATRHRTDEEGSVACQHGVGSWYARFGQVHEWMVKEEARAAGGE